MCTNICISGSWGAVVIHLFCFVFFVSPLVVFSELNEHFCNAGTGKVLFVAAKMLCEMLEADIPMDFPPDSDLLAAIHQLACQAITVCDSGMKLLMEQFLS